MWKARDRATGRLVDREPGGGDRATLERLLERVRRWRPRLYRAAPASWAAYAELLPVGRLHAGKDRTHGIERDHARRRHRPARLRRRSILVARAARMVDAAIALFAASGRNDKVRGLLPMLT